MVVGVDTSAPWTMDRSGTDPVGPAGLVPSDGTFVAPLETPVGHFYLAWSTGGLVALDAATSLEAFHRRMARSRPGAVRPLARVPAGLAEAVAARLQGTSPPEDLPLDLRAASPFQRAVWMATATIPRGEVRPYAWVAARIGHPGAARAVGTALAANPLPLVIPCHRVVRSDGALGAYGLLGPAMKRQLLAWEGLDLQTQEALARRGIRWLADPHRGAICYPSCRRVRGRLTEGLLPISRSGEARGTGYPPCPDCRPVL